MKNDSKQPLTMEQAKARLLKSGKITEKGLAEVRRQFDADPEIQAAREGKSLHILV